MTQLLTAASLVFLTAGSPAPVASRSTAQAPAEAPAQPQAQAPSQDQPDAPSDRRVDPSQPDFTIIGLPTTLKIPRFASAFRVTHRFGRPLGAGDFGDLVSDFFGFDSGAQIGLEYRFGIMAGTQIGIHRTSNQTIEFFAQQHVLGQDRSPVGIDIIGTAEGTENFTESYSPAIGAVISRNLGRHGALYAHPIWVNNTNDQPSELSDDTNNTFIVGLGGRLRIRPTLYLVGEVIPRFGYTPDAVYGSFGIEKRAGGHSFQLNFSNGLGTTLAQLARGGQPSNDWFIGFNISRKFF
jgi:uncharacterized beta barrel domain-containing protein DUF5777